MKGRRLSDLRRFPTTRPKIIHWGWVLPSWPVDFLGSSGIGGGPIKVPVMYLFMEVPLIVATATSNFMIGVTAASSGFVYFRRGDILASLAAPLGVGVFAGSLLGARLAPRVHAKYVIYLLVVVMFYLSGNMLVHFYREFLR